MRKFYDDVVEVSLEEVLANPEDAILEAVSRKLPVELKKKLRKPTLRREMLQKCGKKAFLIPEELKFPVMDPDTCQYDCRLIYAAFVRANQWKKKNPRYTEVAEKARKLYEKNKCDLKIGVHIRETDEIVELSQFAEYVMTLVEDEEMINNNKSSS